MKIGSAKAITRGDVYYISYDNAVGSEQATGRPGVIISSQTGCDSNPVLSVVYLTTSEGKIKSDKINVEILSQRKRSWAICNQIHAVDRIRLKSYYGHVSDSELERIDKSICYSLDIPYGIGVDQTVVNKSEAKNRELTVERDMYKALYEAAIHKLVEKQITRDMVIPEEIPAVVEEVVSEEPQLVDLNTCSATDLRNLGLNEVVVCHVMSARPFRDAKELQLIPGVTKIAWRLLENRVTVSAVEKPKKKTSIEKLNINTADAKEIADKLEYTISNAYLITGYRKKNGPFKNAEELLNVPRFPKSRFAEIAAKITF